MLQRNVKVYGPMNALDTGSSCWNSDASSDKKHSFLIDFRRLCQVHEVRMQFQAGFVAESCRVQLKKDGEWIDVVELEPEDTLEVQSFPVGDRQACALKLVFDDFTDFYGRVIIYRIEVWGNEIS